MMLIVFYFVNYTFFTLNIKIYLTLIYNYLSLLKIKNKKRESAEIKMIEAPEAIS